MAPMIPVPKNPDFRSGLANQPEKLALEALLPEIQAATNHFYRLRVVLSALVSARSSTHGI